MQPSTEDKKDKRSANLFVVNMVIIYALWKAFAYYVHHSQGFVYNTWAKVIYSLGAAYASVTSFVLNVFGENTVHTGISVLYPQYLRSVRVEDHCLAIPATIIFIGSIASFKGGWRDKLWFIPMGIALIILINITRLVFLCYTFAHMSRAFFDINHSLLYVIITYSLIFLLIVWWMRKFALTKGQTAI